MKTPDFGIRPPPGFLSLQQVWRRGKGNVQHHGVLVINARGEIIVLHHGVDRDEHGRLWLSQTDWQTFAGSETVHVERAGSVSEEELQRRVHRVVERLNSLGRAGAPTWDYAIDNCEAIATYLVTGWWVSLQTVATAGAIALGAVLLWSVFKGGGNGATSAA